MTNRLNAFLVLLAVFGIVAFSYFKIQTPAIKTMDSQENTSPNTEQELLDKTFTSTVSYNVPENGVQSMSVTVTLNENVITNISILQSKGAGKSRNYQNNFEASYKSLVLGKDIKSVSLSRVGGASSTTNAFNQAIKSINNQL
jgi:hypothetical protein